MAAAPPSALVRAYLELRPGLVRYFAAKLRSLSAGEDLVQEIYLKIGAMGEGEGVQEPKAWLFRVGTNLMFDQQRSAGRAAARDHAWIGDIEAVQGESVSPEPSAEAVVAGRQRLTRLLAVVDDMPPRMAEAFRLHKLEGVPQHEVARRMGVSVKAIEKHLAGALLRLMQAMPEEKR